MGFRADTKNSEQCDIKIRVELSFFFRRGASKSGRDSRGIAIGLNIVVPRSDSAQKRR